MIRPPGLRTVAQIYQAVRRPAFLSRYSVFHGGFVAHWLIESAIAANLAGFVLRKIRETASLIPCLIRTSVCIVAAGEDTALANLTVWIPVTGWSVESTKVVVSLFLQRPRL